MTYARVLAILVCAATGCAPQQQVAIPPSPTGCYLLVPGVGIGGPLIPLVQPRYTPAPCNVVNANQPIINEQVAAPELPPLQGGGAWGIAGPGGVATGAGGTWSGAGPGWAGAGTGGM